MELRSTIDGLCLEFIRLRRLHGLIVSRPSTIFRTYGVNKGAEAQRWKPEAESSKVKVRNAKPGMKDEKMVAAVESFGIQRGKNAGGRSGVI